VNKHKLHKVVTYFAYPVGLMNKATLPAI